MRIAVVTCEDCPYPAPDDALLVEALSERSIDAKRVAWSDPTIDWYVFDAAVLKSTWDYHHRLQEFLAWTAGVSNTLRLFNPSSVVHWNAHKFYLLELEEKGVRIVPTQFIEQGSTGTECEWPEVVVKPAIAASAYKTIVARSVSPKASAHFRELLAAGDALVQPYLSSVEEGERSLIFIDGQLSHATLKRPKSGDFRVQVEHGGSIELSETTPAEIQVAQEALGALSEQPIFARVDLLNLDSGEPALSELELIEPDLMMEFYPEAAERLAEALLKKLSLSS